MAKSPEEMAQTMIDNLPAKTGKSLQEWLVIVRGSGLQKHGEVIRLLKGEHGMTHGFANLVAHKFLNPDPGSSAEDGDLVAAQYAGTKAPLKPIYEKIVSLVKGFGPEVEIAPKKSYVSLRARKQFAIVQPSTQTRVDLGINLKGRDPQGRLEASGSFNSMVSHRVRLASPEEVDAEVKNWLEAAFRESL